MKSPRASWVWLASALVLTLAGLEARPFQTPARKTPKTPKAPAGGKPAATPADQPWTLASVSVKGNRAYSSEQVVLASGLKVGQPVRKEDFDVARVQLIDSGAFESVAYQYQPDPEKAGYALALEVVEVGQRFPIRLEDLDVSMDELKTRLRQRDPLFVDPLPGTKEMLERTALGIEEFLAARGAPQRVIGRVTAETPNEMIVLFRPDKPLPAVARVMFTGNQVIQATTLQNRMINVAVGTLFTEKRFRQLLDLNIRPMYEARGRLRVEFPRVTTEPATDVKGLLVTVEVLEGPTFDLGKVSVEGDDPAEKLLRAANLKTGDLANFDAVAEGLERIRKQLRREGYMQARARADRTIRDQDRTVDVKIRIERGPRYLFGKLNIRGLDIHGEAAIRKLWTLKPGDPFNGEYPDYFVEQVRERGVFDDLGQARAIVTPDDNKLIVDVELVFSGIAAPAKPGHGLER